MLSELTRVSPADAGLSGTAILRYIDALERCGTEMHGLMIARHGKVCAEGWWKPYAPGMIHGLQSLSKSYVATAIGILFTGGQIRLDEKVVDILPQYLPPSLSENLKSITVHDLLCMGAGNHTMQDRTKIDWLFDFFASEFSYPPGTHFYYSGLVTSVLGAIVRAKTGLGLVDFLRNRLFAKLGIDTDRLKWIEHPDGLEYGGGGLFTTTEDNLRLGLLYLDHGIWQGERILADAWVKAATHKQIETTGEGPADNQMGYGYQMWMCQPAGVFRYDGAHGQFVIVVPDLDMVISINQTADGGLPQKTLELTWAYLAAAPGSDDGDQELAARLARLALPRVPYNNRWRLPHFQTDRVYHFEPNDIDLLPGVYRTLSHKPPRGIEQVSFAEVPGEIAVNLRCQGRDYAFRVSMDGVDRLSSIPAADDLPDKVYASGIWVDQTTLEMTLKYIESCFSVQFTICIQNERIELQTTRFTPMNANPLEKIRIQSI